MNSEQLSDLIIDALEDGKAQDIVRLDVQKLTTVTDYMIVASGTSNRHVKALANAVADKAREAGQKPASVEGADGSEWVLLDLHDALVHVMLPRREARSGRANGAGSADARWLSRGGKMRDFNLDQFEGPPQRDIVKGDIAEEYGFSGETSPDYYRDMIDGTQILSDSEIYELIEELQS